VVVAEWFFCAGSFEADLGDNPHTAGLIWADEEESERRKRLKVVPPPMEQDHAGIMAAQNFMRNAQGLAIAADKQQGRGFYTNIAGYPTHSLEAQPMEQPRNSASSGGKRPMMGVRQAGK
jgi:hypothetical protein